MDENLKFALTLLAGAAGGGIIAGIFAMVGAWIANKREHKRWLNQLKFTCYLDRIKEAEQFIAAAVSAEFSATLCSELMKIADRGIGSDINIVGSTKAMDIHNDLMQTMLRAAGCHEKSQFHTEIKKFSRTADYMAIEMRKDLRVPTKKKYLRAFEDSLNEQYTESTAQTRPTGHEA